MRPSEILTNRYLKLPPLFEAGDTFSKAHHFCLYLPEKMQVFAAGMLSLSNALTNNINNTYHQDEITCL